ncbi:MAG: phosphoribosylglycinamide formyltransferase [Kofleriaceae bacterium]|nr:phosphoribosylglycinamide formyltransferase [Myxococcales bacterium]MCB9563627.1 phosphoribosylglycinamide formyltransferase [Kofleriaceae bacterium]MCB9572879.1 phosphoribosylglycinamide formyltransferase [Kofleriaceae bacterium]
MRVAVLVSGRGTNLQALLDAEARGELAPAEIVCVVSNRPGAAALERARAAGKPAITIDHKAFADRAGFEDALLEALAGHGADAVVLAGFMRVLTPRFVDAYPSRIVNTHPALSPAFPGTDAAGQALRHGVKLTGVTVHFVDAGVDTGPIIAQRAVPVLPGDDAATLQHRIQAEEHRLLPRVVRALAAGRITCEGRRVDVATTDHADELL